jgi:acetyl-CoA carboxylase carboxyl transferase subunit beta
LSLLKKTGEAAANGTVPNKKREIPDGVWTKCPSCNSYLYNKELLQNLSVCSKCGHHFRISWKQRLDLLVEPDSFKELFADISSKNPLEFEGYPASVERSSKKTGLKEGMITGSALIGPSSVGIGIAEFAFMGGSMGSVVGEKVTRIIEWGTANKKPVIVCSTSGGARMQESIFSLMQMAKTSAALARHAEAKLPFISVLSNPTMAGVMASFASLGDIILAEPGALLGFAGPRVIKETIKQELPPGFQSSEFFMEHGFLDIIVKRSELKDRIIKVLDYIGPVEKQA